MTDYKILIALPPEAYVKPDDFVTEYDHDGVLSGHAAEQYAKGLKVSQHAVTVDISVGGTWGAKLDRGVTTSCEGIGYHANTADLLRGFLDGPAPVVVWRLDVDGPTEIKPRTGRSADFFGF